MTTYAERLDNFERRLLTMQRELEELRHTMPVAEPELPAGPEPTREPTIWETLAPPPPPSPHPRPEPERAPRPLPVYEPAARAPLDLSFLFGPRALAWTGGAVTLLGIVFFYVLAMERGWIGPDARVALGALASSVLFGSGLWLRRRYGDTYASVSAVGAGIAGLYATLLVAAALYELVPAPLALLLAGAIAAAGCAVALAWDSETIAGLGLVGALLVPVPVAFQSGLSGIGTAFAALVLAGALVVAIGRDWRGLMVAAAVASAPQIALLVLDHEDHALPLAIVFWLLYAGAGIAHALRSGRTRLSASFLLGSAVLAGYSSATLFSGRREGVGLLIVALSYGPVAGALSRRDRDLASLLFTLGLTVGIVAAADLLSGASLAIAWSAEAAVLAWLARRIDEPRNQLASLLWLTLGLLHAVGIGSPPAHLLLENHHPSAGVLGVAAAVGALLVLSVSTWTWVRRDEGRLLQRPLDDLRGLQPQLRKGVFVLAGALAVYGASLTILEQFASWDWGHVAVTGLWSSVAIATTLTGLRRTSGFVLTAGLVSTTFVVALAASYDQTMLADTQRACALANVAAAALIVAIAYQLAGASDELDPIAVCGVLVSVALAAAAVAETFEGNAEGGGVVALAAGYGALGALTLRRHRDLASTFGLAALVLATAGSIELLDGTWLVLVWAAAAALLTQAARLEQRLEYAALALLALALGHALSFEAQPEDLFVAHRHPGAGVSALLLVIAAGQSVRCCCSAASSSSGCGWIRAREPRRRAAHARRRRPRSALVESQLQNPLTG